MSRRVIIGALLGAVLCGGLYFVASYPFHQESWLTTLLLPVVFGLAVGGLVGHETKPKGRSGIEGGTEGA